MSEDRLNLLRQAVRNMLVALQMPDVDDTELYDLTLHIGHTEAKGEACLKSCPIIFQRDEDDSPTQISPPHTPPSANASNPLRKSSRIASDEKRSYEGMQSRQNGSGRPHKRVKYTIRQKPETVPVRDSIDGFPTDNAAANTLMEVVQEPADILPSIDPLTTPYPLDQPVSNSSTTVTNVEVTTTYAMEHSSNETEPRAEPPPSEPTIPDSTGAIHGSLPQKGHTSMRRPVLDESGNSLESVLEALKSLNTDRITDCVVPGTYAMLADTDPVVFAKIISSIGMNCVYSSFMGLSSALEIEKERLQDHEQNKLSEIKESREQMALFSVARSNKEEEYRREEERLHRETETAISRLSMRELADRDLRYVLSEPVELLGEFKEESEFKNLIKEINKDNASDEMRRGRASMKETYYWLVIQRHANTMGSLPESLGRKSGLTPQEKSTARRLVIALGYGHSRDSILKARSYLKLLSDLREAGVTLLLLHRTKEFRTHFLRYPNNLASVLSWNELYHPRLHGLRLRAIAQSDGDFSGVCDLEDQDIFRRLHIPQGVIWRDDLSEWADTAEKDNYLAAQSIKAVSSKSNAHVLHHGIKGDIDANKAIYVSMIPYEGISAKKTLSGKSPSAKLLAVSPLVSVSPGDFLGIFPGRLRYTDEKPAGAIQGPSPGLWLDRSEVKGKLHWMKVAKAGEETNVCLVWEGVNEVKGQKNFCQYWRILVLATRHVGPFDRLIRPA